MKKTSWLFFFLRVAIGGLFIYSGYSKLMEPSSNFVGVILGYRIVGARTADALATVLPWTELVAGSFFLLGLWTREALMTLAFFCALFFSAILSTFIRKIPLHDCGCFGQGAHALPLWATLAIDGALLMVLAVMSGRMRETRAIGLDDRLEA